MSGAPLSSPHLSLLEHSMATVLGAQHRGARLPSCYLVPDLAQLNSACPVRKIKPLCSAHLGFLLPAADAFLGTMLCPHEPFQARLPSR